MANLDRILEVKDLENVAIKKLNKPDLIKAITHINEEPNRVPNGPPDPTSLDDLVESAMQRIPSKETDGLLKECIIDIVTAVVHVLAPLTLSHRQSETEKMQR